MNDVTSRRRAAALLLLLALLVLLLRPRIAAPPRPPTPSSWSWRPSGLEGGGFQNVIALDAQRPGRLVVGGDVAGFHTSTDGGDEWVTSNRGLGEGADLAVSAVTFSRFYEDTIYAGTGTITGGGGFLASTDGGASWSYRSRAVRFSPVSLGHPRATGNLIVTDEDGSRDFIYAGTATGVARSTDGGHTWTTLGLSGAAIRTLALDPTDPTVLYVGVGANGAASGAYRFSHVRGETEPTRLADAPPVVEEFATVGERLYAAASSAGVFEVGSRGRSWTPLAPSFFSSASSWSAIAGAVDERGRHVLVAGCADPVAVDGGYRSIARSEDGGATWTDVTAAGGAIDIGVAGAAGKWWLVRGGTGYLLGQRFYDVAQLAIDPGDPRRVFAAGRSGVWRSEDAGETWAPAVHHLAVTLAWSVAAEGPDVAVAPTDWGWLGSADRARSFVRRRPPGGGSYGTAVAWGGDGSAYASTGRRDSNVAGGLFRNREPPTGPWTDVTPPVGGRHVLGVVTGTAPDGASDVVLAAVNGAGVWRREGDGAWRQVAQPGLVMGFQGPTNNATSLSWPDPRLPYVYLLDGQRGLFMSSDRGSTWTRVWTGRGAGYVAGDPTTPGLVYLSSGGRLYRIDDARARGSPVYLRVARAGPLAVGDDGAVYALSTSVTPRLPEDPDGTPSRLWRSLDRGASWDDISDDFFARSTARPKWLAISSDNSLYVATLGNGLVVGDPR